MFMTLSLSVFGKQVLAATCGSVMNAKTISLMSPKHHLLTHSLPAI